MVTQPTGIKVFARESTSDRILLIAFYTLLTLVALAVAYPVVYVISSSFSSPTAVSSGKVVLLPVEFNLLGYKLILQYKPLWMGFMNSTLYALGGGILRTTLTLLAAYPLSRRDFVGKRAITVFMAFTMFFGGGLIPTYLLYSNLNLINKRLVMIVPGAVSVFHIIVARTFLKANIPDELFDAASVDGCGHFRFFRSVVLPLSTPLMAIVFLFAAVEAWNSYFDALVFLHSPELMPIQIVLRGILIENKPFGGYGSVTREMERLRMNDLLKYGMIVIGSLPLMIAYPFVQKHFVKGMLIGSIKG
ncbi:MAG: carbohydrate ABC transporter permease [Anaerolineae bacterium]